jgi:hypothetical protein
LIGLVESTRGCRLRSAESAGTPQISLRGGPRASQQPKLLRQAQQRAEHHQITAQHSGESMHLFTFLTGTTRITRASALALRTGATSLNHRHWPDALCFPSPPAGSASVVGPLDASASRRRGRSQGRS